MPYLYQLVPGTNIMFNKGQNAYGATQENYLSRATPGLGF